MQSCQLYVCVGFYAAIDSYVRSRAVIVPSGSLPYYNPDDELIVENDACEYGIGSALMQKDGPIDYASRSLSSVEQRYAQIEKGMLAVVFGLKRLGTTHMGEKSLL